MKDKILRLIRTDVLFSRYVCSLKILNIEADVLLTDNLVVILWMMQIPVEDQISTTYYSLVESVNHSSGEVQPNQLIETIYEYLESCRNNLELPLAGE